MTETLHQFCERSLDQIRENDLHRTLRLIESPQSAVIRINGKEYKNFSSNDYLGLANHPELKDRAVHAAHSGGVGAGASPLISGYHESLEKLQLELARLKGTESALVFNSGYSTSIGTITSLFGSQDILIIDKLCHASLIDGARNSGAKLRVFRHNDLLDLEKKLQWARSIGNQDPNDTVRHIGVIAESIYSMDGDSSPLSQMVDLKNSYGAWLLIDEAHSTGLFGEDGRGYIQSLGLSDEVEIQMGTLGKALGCSGGFIAGSNRLIDFLVNSARSFIFSTAPSPIVCSAATAAVQIIQSNEGKMLRKNLGENIDTFYKSIPEKWKQKSESMEPGLHLHEGVMSPILPWWVGTPEKAIQLSNLLMDHGFFVPAIRFPTVPKNTSRLRITISASHATDTVQDLAGTLIQCHEKLKRES